MKTGWIVGIVMAYIILAIFGLICDQVWFDGSTLKTINTLMYPNWDSAASSIPVIGPIVGALVVVKGWLDALLTVIFLKFDFWSGSYVIFWYIFCIPLGVGVIASIVIGILHR